MDANFFWVELFVGSLLRFAFQKAKSVAKRVGTERRRSMLGIFKKLFFSRTCPYRLVKRGLQIVDVKIQVHWRPVTIIVSHIACMRRGSALLRFFQQSDRRGSSL